MTDRPDDIAGRDGGRDNRGRVAAVREDGMKEVSKDEFYSTIGQLDVVLTPTHIGDGRYRTEFRLRYGGLKGVSVGQPGYPVIHKYYITEGAE